MVAEQFIQNAYGAIVSWTYILLTILLIVKIIQFFTGGSFGSWGKDKDTDPESKKYKPDRVSPEEEEKIIKKKKLGEPEGLDVENPGFVKVIVLDTDDNPIQGAKVRITPANMRKRRWGRTKRDWREYGDLTGPDGVWPSGGRFESVGSGSVIISVTKTNWYNITWYITWFNRDRFYEKKYYEIIPGQQHEITVIMDRKGEKAEAFEPKIWEVAPIDDKTMKVKGIINVAE
jgi:hypothetical protein